MLTHHHWLAPGMHHRLMHCIIEKECQRVETSSGLMMSNYGGRWRHIISSVLILWSPWLPTVSLLCSSFMSLESLKKPQCFQSQQTAHVGSAVEQLSVFWLIHSEECVLGLTVDCCFRLWLHSRVKLKMLKWSIKKPHPRCLTRRRTGRTQLWTHRWSLGARRVLF